MMPEVDAIYKKLQAAKRAMNTAKATHDSLLAEATAMKKAVEKLAREEKEAKAAPKTVTKTEDEIAAMVAAGVAAALKAGKK